MNPIYFIVPCVIAGIFLAHHVRARRLLAGAAATAARDAMRYRRHMERLEMVLREVEPALLAQVTARSEMEWQQAVKGLDEGALPTLYPLETAFQPINPRTGIERVN